MISNDVHFLLEQGDVNLLQATHPKPGRWRSGRDFVLASAVLVPFALFSLCIFGIR
jgi:hypothetical protein